MAEIEKCKAVPGGGTSGTSQHSLGQWPAAGQSSPLMPASRYSFPRRLVSVAVPHQQRWMINGTTAITTTAHYPVVTSPTRRLLATSTTATATTASTPKPQQRSNRSPRQSRLPWYQQPGKQTEVLLRVGAPFVLFSVLSAWVVSNAVEGKLKEMETAQGKSSQSIRQAALAAEHDEMMERLNHIVAQDFDNQKRIKRPHEVLEERRQERQRRNAWHRRLYRSVFGDTHDDKKK